MQVPGSPLGINHPFAWYAIVKDKTTGKEWTYWMNGSQLNREAVALHIATHYPGVDVVTIDPCTGPPTRTLQPVPPTHFEHGIRVAAEKELRELANDGGPPPISFEPIDRTPLPRIAIPRRSLRQS